MDLASMKDADKPRRGPGQPPFEPTAEQRLFVQMWAANGTPQDVIARNVPLGRGQRGIAEKTLRKAFREELDAGYADTLARMGATVVREGLKGQGWAVRYWLDRRGGQEWKPTENVHHGLTPDAKADGASLVAPVLVIRPVRAIDVTEQKPDEQ